MHWSPHPFTLRQLQYALAVAQTEGFRKAAEVCHVSQPSLSTQVAQLEDVLGVTLFERGSGGVRALPGTQQLLERMRNLLVDAEALQLAARQVSEPLSGSLRIGVIPTLSPYLVPLVVGPMRKAFPKLQPLWIEQKTPAIRTGLAEGHLNAALVALEADYGEVDSEILGTDLFVFAAHKGHPLTRKTGPISLSSLKEEQVLLLEEGHCLRDQALSFCHGLREHDAGVRATSLTTLAQMVAGGAGVTFLPSLALDQENPHGRIAWRALAAPAPSRTIALIWRRRSAWTGPMGEVAKVLGAAVRPLLTSDGA